MAGLNRAGGYADYSSSGSNVYVPEIYSGKLVTKFYETTVFGSIASTDYEGEIKGMGDNIIIRTVPSITVSDYQIGSTFSAADYQVPTSPTVELPINKGKKFMVRLNTVDRAQSDLDLASIFADEASMQLKISMDRDMLANIYADVSADNSGSTAGVISNNINLGTTAAPLSVNSSTIIRLITDMARVLDEQNVSDEGRWIVLPAWMVQKLKLSDLKDASITGDNESTLRNGRVGRIDRFTVYRSNLLDVSEDSDTPGTFYTNVIAGHSTGLAWASQIVEMEQLQNPWDFGSLMRGLCVYGYKVIEPKYLVHARVLEGAEA